MKRYISIFIIYTVHFVRTGTKLLTVWGNVGRRLDWVEGAAGLRFHSIAVLHVPCGKRKGLGIRKHANLLVVGFYYLCRCASIVHHSCIMYISIVGTFFVRFVH